MAGADSFALSLRSRSIKALWQRLWKAITLKFEEIYDKFRQVVYVSATPGQREIEQAEGDIVLQVVRPTGLLDPSIEVRPATGQVDDCLKEIRVKTTSNPIEIEASTNAMQDPGLQFDALIAMAEVANDVFNAELVKRVG